ncbi:hypothetical protein [Saccharothrix luteola]|uniref:hypothetical protein n=1 Tax=Saccharothrix luteola TaxID=2893018 RepID=UPI001E4CE6F4|nr:hypothetical protein [Saccharothrix luteola]MCC8247084.1 hypothetical protein [Saccharothrix luteola]MCC8249875.1 hypothetical protein [Saccharothrix luteola]
MRDWLLVAGVAGTAPAEVVVRADVVWRPVGVVAGVALALAMLWRRVRPLAAVGLGFGGLMVVDLASVLGGKPFSPYAGGSSSFSCTRCPGVQIAIRAYETKRVRP